MKQLMLMRMTTMRQRWWWRTLPSATSTTAALALFFNLIVMMKAFNDFSILAWNVRGFANRKSWNHMHDIVNRYKPDVIFLFETHTSSKSFWAREGYDKIEIQEARGQSGGIWVIQRRGNDYNFSLVRMMHQCVSFSISKGMEKWLCSAVYASPSYTVRAMLWDHFDQLARDVVLPWLLLGDFNDILLPREQRRGVFSVSKAEVFARNIDRCGLIES
jgi:hypothetical protein